MKEASLVLYKTNSNLRFSVNPNFHFVASLRFSDNHAQVYHLVEKCGDDHIVVGASYRKSWIRHWFIHWS